MKRLSLKPSHILSITVCLLVFGAAVRFLQPKRYPHEHLSTSALEPRAKLQTVDYKLRDGQTLAEVARLRYGHQNYYSVIKLYNHIADERQMAANFGLRLPDMSVIVADEGLVRVVPQEIGLILCSRAKYDKVVDQLWALRSQSPNNHLLPEGIQQELLEAADDLQQAIESLKVTRTGMNGVPVHTIGQLQECLTLIKLLAAGELSDPNGYNIDMVQQRYALALTYAILWARDGFK